MMKKILATVLVLSCANVFAAGNSANGKKVWDKVKCIQCHKKDGLGMAASEAQINAMKGPRIAGLSEAYIIAQMNAIKSGSPRGTRPAKNISSMKTKIKSLSTQDIADVAAYVSKDLNPAAGKHTGLVK
jgi:cytochrome c553